MSEIKRQFDSEPPDFHEPDSYAASLDYYVLSAHERNQLQMRKEQAL